MTFSDQGAILYGVKKSKSTSENGAISRLPYPPTDMIDSFSASVGLCDGN